MISENESFVRRILESIEDNAPRLIYADWLQENGKEEIANKLRKGPITERNRNLADYVGDGDNGGGDGGYDDGGGGGIYGDGYGFGDGGYDGNGDGNDIAPGGGEGERSGRRKTDKREGVTNMQNGLYLLSIPSGYNPYVIVGWVEIEGFELTVRNARVIRRFGSNQSLSKLAENGPANDTQLLEKSKLENIWRPAVSRALPAKESAWKKECPKPKDFETNQGN